MYTLTSKHTHFVNFKTNLKVFISLKKNVLNNNLVKTILAHTYMKCTLVIL